MRMQASNAQQLAEAEQQQSSNEPSESLAGAPSDRNSSLASYFSLRKSPIEKPWGNRLI